MMLNIKRLFVFGSLLVCVFGCADEGAKSSSSRAETTETRPSFDEDGLTWKKEAVTPEDLKLLSDYLSENASLAGNPTIDGDPLVYRGDAKSVRYYWVTNAPDGARWIRFDSAGGRITGFKEGTGFPFDADAS